jgi:hypothetical protein
MRTSQAVVDVAPDLARLEQSTVPETGEMTAGVSQAQSSRERDFARSEFSIAQGLEDRQPRRIGEPAEESRTHGHVDRRHHLSHWKNDSVAWALTRVVRADDPEYRVRTPLDSNDRYASGVLAGPRGPRGPLPTVVFSVPVRGAEGVPADVLVAHIDATDAFSTLLRTAAQELGSSRHAELAWPARLPSAPCSSDAEPAQVQDSRVSRSGRIATAG